MNPGENDHSKLPVPAIGHAFSILKLLGSARTPMGVTAIARSLELSPSSCFNLLKTLLAEGMVDFDTSSKKYNLGLGLLQMAHLAAPRVDVIRVAMPLMDELAETHDVACGLWRISEQERLILISLSESAAATRIRLLVGQRQPVYAGATGRAIAAARNVPSRELRASFTTIRWGHPVSFERYVEQVKMTYKRGWAVDDGLFLRGVTTVAATAKSYDGKPHFCVSCTMFKGSHNNTEIAEIGTACTGIAEAIATIDAGHDVREYREPPQRLQSQNRT